MVSPAIQRRRAGDGGAAEVGPERVRAAARGAAAGVPRGVRAAAAAGAAAAGAGAPRARRALRARLQPPAPPRALHGTYHRSTANVSSPVNEQYC